MKFRKYLFYAVVLMVAAVFAAGVAYAPYQPKIELLKEVSVDGGATFFDANGSDSAPVAALGGVALYRFTAANPGTNDLENVVINDATLGIVNFPVGDLAAGVSVVLTEGKEIPALEPPVRCEDPGDVTNIATVDGQSVGAGNPVMDSDPAVVRCVEEDIDLLKEVSVDGGVTFYDANDDASAPVTVIGGGALYRLTVTNTGTSYLENVVINDATLGITDFPVGDLAAGQSEVLTEVEIPKLEQPGRCQDPGDVSNIATVDGQSVVHTGNTVSDSDPAVVRCVEEDIDLLKEVSVDGGLTFYDANDGASAPVTVIGGGALYRLTVTNTGTSDLENVVINDPTLGIVGFPVGGLAAGVSVVLTGKEIPALEQPGRCQDPGDVTNIATVDGQSVVHTGNTASDSDPAVVRCVVEDIQLVKEVSVDGGATFYDANDSASAPATAIGGGALYRLIVTNTGTSYLENVVINDPTLGFVGFPVGDLAAGQSVGLTAGEIPKLDQPGRCQDPGDVTNIATVDGESVVHTGNRVSDSDPAVVRCVEEDIDLLKEVSVDGGATFYDANDSASAPATAIGGGALYRLTVTNTGTSDLENVVINDPTLGIVGFPVGDLAAGQSMGLTAGEIPKLDQPGRCQDPGDVTNIATVDGQSAVHTGNTVSDSDPAVVRCVEEDIDLLKEVSVDGGLTFYDANDSASAPATAIGGGALYRLIVTNTGTSDLVNVLVNDPTLGIVGFPVGDLAAGQSEVLTEVEIPKLEQPGRCQDPGDVSNIATVDGQSVVHTGNRVSDSDPAVVRCEGGGEGCTPGYWKQGHHFYSWTAPFFMPSTPFSDVFENAFPGKTLLDVLGQGGGHLYALGRHTVAALLNAASAKVSYDLAVNEVIDMFNNVGGDYEGLKDYFEGFNEQGCPLNNGREGNGNEGRGEGNGNNGRGREGNGNNGRGREGNGNGGHGREGNGNGGHGR